MYMYKYNTVQYIRGSSNTRLVVRNLLRLDAGSFQVFAIYKRQHGLKSTAGAEKQDLRDS